jgi:hypothetical protein
VKSNYDFFGLTPISGFGDTGLRPTRQTAITMHSGGSLDQRVLIENFNLTVYHLLFCFEPSLLYLGGVFLYLSQQLIPNLVGRFSN